MSKAYSYIRFSTPEQLHGDSLRRQLDASAQYAKQHDLVLDDSLRDLGVSGFSGQNREKGALSRFLGLIRSGRIDAGSYLLVENLDRLSRSNPYDAFSLFSEIINAGVVIVTLQDNAVFSRQSLADSDRGFAALMQSILKMQLAHDESAKKSKRLAAAWMNKRRQIGAKKLTARCPAWLELNAERTQFTLLADRVRVVERIFRESIAGVGRRKIANRLNADGIAAFNGSAGWHDSYVHKVLTNEATIGIFQPHRKEAGKRIPEGGPIRDYYPAIVDEATYWRAQQARGRRESASAGRKGRHFSNLFSGIALCNACHARMVYRDKGLPPKGGRYLVCGRAVRNVGCSNKRHYRYDVLERAILQHVIEIDPSVLFTDSASVVQNLQQQVDALGAQRAALRHKISRLIDLAEDGNDIRERLQKRRAELSEIEKCLSEQELALKKATHPETVSRDRISELKRLTELMAGADDHERYLIRSNLAHQLRLVLDLIMLGSGSEEVVAFTAKTERAYHINDDKLVATVGGVRLGVILAHDMRVSVSRVGVKPSPMTVTVFTDRLSRDKYIPLADIKRRNRLSR